jgi:hypothetical protein
VFKVVNKLPNYVHLWLFESNLTEVFCGSLSTSICPQAALVFLEGTSVAGLAVKG